MDMSGQLQDPTAVDPRETAIVTSSIEGGMGLWAYRGLEKSTNVQPNGNLKTNSSVGQISRISSPKKICQLKEIAYEAVILQFMRPRIVV
jgi:hypothetical protein